jgi:hypothetical protein
MVYGSDDLGAGRRRLGWIALTIFLLSFTLAPIAQGL